MRFPLPSFGGLAFGLTASTCWPAVVSAADLHVPSEYATIQSAIDAAGHNDVVRVAAGTYNEAIDFLGKEILVFALFGPDATTIDATGLGATAVTFASAEGFNSVLNGFTITGGDATFGGGIHCAGTAPTLQNLVITGNTAWQGGGVFISGEAADPRIIDCEITSNTALIWGGGIDVGDGAPSVTVRSCTIEGNTAGIGGGGLRVDSDAAATVSRTTFIDNHTTQPASFGGGIHARSGLTAVSCRVLGNSASSGGGIHASGAPSLVGCEIIGNVATETEGGGVDVTDGEIINCTVTGNHAETGGGGAFVEGVIAVRNTILHGNTSTSGDQNIEAPTGAETVTIAYSNLGGSRAPNLWSVGWSLYDGGGNIDHDPGFVNALGSDGVVGTLDDDVRLRRHSRCIDSGDAATVIPDVVDLDGDLDLTEMIPFDLAGAGRLVDDGEVVDRGLHGTGHIIDMGAHERQDDSYTLEWIVTSSGSIQARINDARETDTIFVEPGVYAEMIDLQGKDIALIATGGPELTTIDGGGLGTCVTIAGHFRDGALLDGFTLTGGNEMLGGAIVCIDSSPTLRNLIVTGNTAFEGGGLLVSGAAAPTLVDSHLTSNTGLVSGGGIHVGPGPSSLTARSCVIEDNTAGISGAGLQVHSDGAAIVSRTTFANNHATQPTSFGGAVSGSGVTLVACRVHGNSAARGGGIMAAGASAMVSCEITDNAATAAWGGGVELSDGALINCTITGNSAVTGGGGALLADVVDVQNSILWGNSSITGEPNVEAPTGAETVTIRNSNLGGSGAPAHWNVGWSVYDGGGNIDAFPVFADAAAGNYALLAGSPCIDAGDTTLLPADALDLDGDGDQAESSSLDVLGTDRLADDPETIDTGVADVTGIVVDMGSAEYAVAACPSDVDGDGTVGFTDVVTVLAAWGSCSGCPADVDGNGDVGFADLLLVLSAWGPCD